MSNLGDVLSKLVYSNVLPPAVGGYGGLGAKPPAAGRFLYVFGKKNYLNPIGSHFARVHRYLKELDFSHLKANRKNLTVQFSFYLQLKSKIRLKSCIMV